MAADSPSKAQENKLIKWLKYMFIWYPANYTTQERKLLFKLDLIILVYGCISFFAKFLDQTNITNAYVSGMKEDLSLYGNELNWLNITYLSGYVLGQIPFLLLMSRPKFSKYVLPTLEILYGICTFCQSRITNIDQLYALRFLVGLFEAPSFAGVHQILGVWYGSRPYKGNPPELFVRAGTWFLCSSLGSMFSGYLQSAAYRNLSGVGGMRGWQWLFIIDGIITIPIAFVGYAFWPGLPDSGKPWYLNKEEYSLALTRTKRNKIEKPGKLDRSVWKRTFTQWKWYVFVAAYISMMMGYYPTNYFSLWLKAQKKYTVYQINNYPTVTNAVTIISSFTGTALAAVFDPWKIFLVSISGQVIFGIIMIIYDVPPAATFFAFYIAGTAGCSSPILYSSINRILRGDQEQKAIVMGSMMSIGYFVYTWLPLALYPTAASYGERAAPRWKVGYPTQLAFTILLGSFFLLATYLDKRDTIDRGETVEVEEDVIDSDESSFSELHDIENGKVHIVTSVNNKSISN